MTTVDTTAAHPARLRPAATAGRAGRGAASSAKSVVLRLAGADDAPALRRLAEIDEEPELCGAALLALVDGVAVAALALDDGRVVANPFVPTSDAVSLLRLRAGHLLGPALRRRRRSWRPRFRRGGGDRRQLQPRGG